MGLFLDPQEVNMPKSTVSQGGARLILSLEEYQARYISNEDEFRQGISLLRQLCTIINQINKMQQHL
jgi:hypothetical protein